MSVLRTPLRSPIREAIYNPIQGKWGSAINTVPQLFITDGGPIPWYAGATHEPHLHYNGKTYSFWESYEQVPDKRFTRVRAFDHAAGTWGKSYPVGPASAVEDDSHGVPGACVNADGRLVVAWGNHDGNFHLSVSTNAEDESVWTVASDLSGAYTYPHPLLVGSAVNILFRKNFAPGTGGFTNGAKVFVYRPVTFTGATAAIGNEVTIADFGDNSRWYQGNCRFDGSLWWQVACRADFGDNFRRDVYLYAIDFANSRLQAFDGTTAAFPVDRTTMDSTFRLKTTASGSNLQVPSLVIDTESTPRFHIAFSEGVADSDDVPIYHMIGVSGTFGEPTAVSGATVSRDQDAPRLVNEANGRIGLYWPNDPKTVETFAGGGNIYRKVLPVGGAAGAFGTTELLHSFDESRWPLNQISAVYNAHADIRAIWTEVAMTENDSGAFPYKRGYAYGDSGFKGKSAPSAANPSAWTGEGFWLDASDLSTMWQDTSGTVAAEVDSVVGLWQDKSGNGNDFVAQGSEFPVLRENDGSYWLDFGDEISPTGWMLAAEFVPSASNAYWASIAGRCWAATSVSQDFLCMDEGTGTGDRYLRIVMATQTLTGVFFAGSGTAVNATESTTTRLQTDFVAGGHCNGTAITLYKDGAQVDTDTTAGNPDTTACACRIGQTSSGTNPLRGRVYGAIWRAGNADATTRNADMAWLESKMPR